MTNDILSYLEMCQREGLSLQKGMNFGVGGGYSILLMSVLANAPYQDRIEENGTVIIYEGHNAPRSNSLTNPQVIDQPALTRFGTLTENGKFLEAALGFKEGLRPPEQIRMYEKVRAGIWIYNGLFHLVDAWQEHDGTRRVYKFRLIAVVESEQESTSKPRPAQRRRIIPTEVKRNVWKRDKGRCVMCGSTEDLHFDHVLPFSKGGASTTAENVQLLCAHHNLQKSDHIV